MAAVKASARDINGKALTCRAPTDLAALLPACSLDGRVQMWNCGADGALASAACLDMREQLNVPSTKLLCLAASPNDQLLAAGGCTGLLAFARWLAGAPCLPEPWRA